MCDWIKEYIGDFNGLVLRKNHPQNTRVHIGNVTLGGADCPVIAGPCAVESEEGILNIARKVKRAGASVLRGGIFKPRTSPYDFQGIGDEAIKWLVKAKEETGLPIVTEIVDISQLELMEPVDMLQVGARNMQNFELLKKLGRQDKPILLKRNPASTVKELLMAAEYIMAEGNGNVILCERGIRTFESATRNTMDLAAIPLIRMISHLPVIADPSHGTGRPELIAPMSAAAVSAGASGIMIEVHSNPVKALSDGKQAVDLAEFARIMKLIKSVGVELGAYGRFRECGQLMEKCYE